jgi:hypothetical protein
MNAKEQVLQSIDDLLHSVNNLQSILKTDNIIKICADEVNATCCMLSLKIRSSANFHPFPSFLTQQLKMVTQDVKTIARKQDSAVFKCRRVLRKSLHLGFTPKQDRGMADIAKIMQKAKTIAENHLSALSTERFEYSRAEAIKLGFPIIPETAGVNVCATNSAVPAVTRSMIVVHTSEPDAVPQPPRESDTVHTAHEIKRSDSMDPPWKK